MVEEAGAAQARALLREMQGQVFEISRKLEDVERRHRRTSIRGASLDRRQLAALRRELYEAHHIIDGLHRRFPETLPVGHRACSAG